MVRFISDPARRPPIAVVLFVAALTVQAQPIARPAKPDPLNPRAGVPALTYESSFAHYRRLADQKPVEPSKVWREANDTVARIGGWRVYAREAQQPGTAATAQPAPAASAPTPQPTPPGHAGHKP